MPELRGMHLHFDCFSGIAGDMTLGAFLDLGMPRGVLDDALGKLGVGGYRVEVAKTRRKTLVGTDVKVIVEGHDHGHGHGERSGDGDEDVHVHEEVHEDGHGGGHGHGHGHGQGHGHGHGHRAHRHYGEIRQIVSGAGLAPGVAERALAIFDRIAAAESKLHGVAVNDVHFHEVGAIDSIVDVVGAAAALDWLSPASVSSTPVPTGSGTVKCAHGVLPVPAPATLEILKGAPLYEGGVAREMTTPTGAAILAATVTRWGAPPAMTVRATGYGAGDADFPDRPNLLRIVVGETTARADASCVLLEANIDDMNPELYQYAEERAFAAGALDVWLTPIQMKKGRPAVKLSALATPERAEAIAAALFRETTTIGIRSHAVERRVLERRHVTVDTAYGPIRVKVAGSGAGDLNAAPEHDMCRAAATQHGVPLKDVYAAAVAAYLQRK